jgi:hypothetical protein
MYCWEIRRSNLIQNKNSVSYVLRGGRKNKNRATTYSYKTAQELGMVTVSNTVETEPSTVTFGKI